MANTFLHGGPGLSEVAMHNFKKKNRLENHFTADLMIEDTIQVSEYLMKRVKIDKYITS